MVYEGDLIFTTPNDLIGCRSKFTHAANESDWNSPYSIDQTAEVDIFSVVEAGFIFRNCTDEFTPMRSNFCILSLYYNKR